MLDLDRFHEFLYNDIKKRGIEEIYHFHHNYFLMSKDEFIDYMENIVIEDFSEKEEFKKCSFLQKELDEKIKGIKQEEYKQ